MMLPTSITRMSGRVDIRVASPSARPALSTIA
jgi:hypothetical protein